MRKLELLRLEAIEKNADYSRPPVEPQPQDGFLAALNALYDVERDTMGAAFWSGPPTFVAAVWLDALHGSALHPSVAASIEAAWGRLEPLHRPMVRDLARRLGPDWPPEWSPLPERD